MGVDAVEAEVSRRPRRLRVRLPLGAAAVLVSLLCFAPTAAFANSDPAWRHFEDGMVAYEAHRFGDALTAWQEAASERNDRFTVAVAAVDAAMALPEAKTAWDSISTLVQRLADEEFGERAFAEILSDAGGSSRREMELLHSQTKSKALGDFTNAWLAVEGLRGAQAIHDSLKALRTLAEDLRSYPEAEFGIGRVFFVEGELRLAEMQFQRALAGSAALEIPDQRYDMMAALAEVYKSEGNWKDYESELELSLSDAGIFTSDGDFLRTAMERAIDLDGYDALQRLYPVDEPRIAAPSGALGEFLLANGRAQAVIHLALAADAIVTQAMKRLQVDDPTIEYSTLVDFSSRVALDAELAAFCDKSGLWRYLYRLGEALLADSRIDSGRSLLLELEACKGSGAWGKAAALALARPYRNLSTSSP